MRMRKRMAARVDDDGNLVIPEEFRRKHGLDRDAKVVVESTDEGLMLRPVSSLSRHTYSDERRAEFLLSNATKRRSTARPSRASGPWGWTPSGCPTAGPVRSRGRASRPDAGYRSRPGAFPPSPLPAEKPTLDRAREVATTSTTYPVESCRSPRGGDAHLEVAGDGLALHGEGYRARPAGTSAKRTWPSAGMELTRTPSSFAV